MRNDQGERTGSCCGDGDCYPTRFELKADGWYFERKAIDPSTGEREEVGQWVKLPDLLLESNQPDPRESPDGRGHVCDSGLHTFCAVLGAGI